MTVLTREDRAPLRRLLWRWAGVTAYCARRQREISEYTELMNGVADIHRSMPASSQKQGQALASCTEAAAERLSDLRERYRERIDDLTSEIEVELNFAAAMDEAMAETLTEQECAVVEYRYKREKQFDEIARRLNYSKSVVERAERGAVEKLAMVVNIMIYDGL